MHTRFLVLVFFLCALGAHAAFSIDSRDLSAKWGNVPPVPTTHSAAMMALGDPQLFYRMSGVMIQNMGDMGGQVTPLYKYDYDRLGKWFFLMDSLDWRSNYIPLLAAFYFGGTQKPEQLSPIINYLAEIGQRTYGEKWRWLAQAVYLARFRQEDLEKAQKLAYILAAHENEDLPLWARQMPGFVAGAMGDKETAYNIAINILKNDREKLHPAEVNFLVSYICERVLDESEALQHPLCKDYE